mmetsp:Transcript_11235/g.14800  ORF Transcript_11235/g.14800 Transcript_11235/m.14800 type:complete len:82 (+) Transcript_11235:1040-1285(+)
MPTSFSVSPFLYMMRRQRAPLLLTGMSYKTSLFEETSAVGDDGMDRGEDDASASTGTEKESKEIANDNSKRIICSFNQIPK